MDNYILQNGEPVPEPDLIKWSEWFAQSNDERVVKQDTLPSGVMVSTVFLSIDHNFSDGPPILYETMIFDGPLNEEQERYHTKQEAEAGHARMLERAIQAEAE